MSFSFRMLACSLLIAPAFAESPQAALDAWQTGRSGGIAVAVVTADDISFYQCGQFSAKDARPIGPDTLFEIGSVTKVFSAILLADAIERGILGLDDPVGAPFPASAVTYRQLATHTSGLPRLPPSFAGSDPADPYADETLPALVRAFAAAAPAAKPSAPAYSNFGFAVLGQAAAAADHEPWPVAIKTHVLVPLGLRDTFVSWRDADAQRLAPGHNGTRRVASWTFDAYAPAGAIVSSARELSRFVQAALGLIDTPVNPAIAATLRRIIGDEHATRDGGLAWVLERRGENKLAWHNGQTGGFHSFVGLHPLRHKGVVVLSNDVTDVEPLGYSLLTGERLPAAKATPNADASTEIFLGDYALTPSVWAAITAEGKQLYFQLTNQERLQMKPLADDRFALEGVEAEVVFEREGNERRITALVLNQNGLAQRARRVAAGQKLLTRQEITLAADEVEAYVGRYQLAPGAVFTMRRDDNRLFAQLTGQQSNRVFAEQKDKFFYKVVDAQLTFEHDASGKVVAVVLHQNGRDLRAPRLD